jgi:hypothetical protein
MGSLAQRLGLVALNSGLLSAVAGIAPCIERLAYTLKFARWYQDNELRSLMLPTPESFGRQNRYLLYEHVLSTRGLADKAIDYLEFGVADGASLQWWLRHNRNPRNPIGSRYTIIYIDCDLYSATIYVLVHLFAQMKEGDVLFFDEFADVTHEFRAYEDFRSACGPKFQIIGAANGGHKLALELLSRNSADSAQVAVA